MTKAAKAPNLFLPVGGFSKTKKKRVKNGVHITEKKIKQGGKVSTQYRGVIWQSGKMIWQSCEYYQKKAALINSMRTVANHINKFIG